MPRGGRRGLAAFVLCCGLSLPGARSEAMAVWPTGWNPLTAGGGPYTDVIGDENPDSTDLVGGYDGSAIYTAGFWAIDEAADQISLRMRLDADGTGSNNVWQFLMDTDGNPTTIDWVLEVRQSGNPAGRQVIFTSATTGGPTFNDIALSTSFAWTGALADWSRWGAVDDGSLFDGDADFFLDVAIPLSEFNLHTGQGPLPSFGLTLATSTSHTQVNKDLPLGLQGTDPVGGGFTPVPEPDSGVLLAAGLAMLVGGVRRRRLDPQRGRCR